MPPIQGIVLLNKPEGISSNRALGRAKYIFRTKKAGHTGSLDPIATGMLPLCFGEATKFSRFLLDANKVYLVSAQLGIRTNTGDTEGEILKECNVSGITYPDIVSALAQFKGQQQQIPPMFSALKHKGQPLYKLARQGIEIERLPRQIEIFNIEMCNLAFEPDASRVQFRVACSKGTYIRTLVDDLGELLGCGAHVTALHRESVAGFKSDQMYDLETLEAMDEANILEKAVLPIDIGLRDWPEVSISSSSHFYLRQGQSIHMPDKAMGWTRIKSETGDFLGMGEIQEDGRLVPRRLLQSMAM